MRNRDSNLKPHGRYMSYSRPLRTDQLGWNLEQTGNRNKPIFDARSAGRLRVSTLQASARLRQVCLPQSGAGIR
jgi:hypothetical protein